MQSLTNQDRKSIVKKVKDTLGYYLTYTDFEIINPQYNIINVRSVRGIFFEKGKPLHPQWGIKEWLPKNFNIPKEEISCGKYTIVFD